MFSFPNPVNDKAARTVAAVVLIEVIVILATGWYWLMIPLAYGFWARVLDRPEAEPAGLDRDERGRAAPRREGPVPGPPKRFAQGMGAVMASLALLFGLILGDHVAADVVLVLFYPGGRARVDLRALPGLQGLRGADAGRADPGGGLRRVRGHQPPARLG